MVNGRIDHARTDVRAKIRDGGNAESVAQDAERDHGQCKHSLLPGSYEEEVASEETGNEENQAGANPAAFFGDHDADTGKVEEQSLANEWCVRNTEE